MKTKPMTFAAKLKAVRQREGYSQATAAELAEEVPLRTYQQWEQGQQTPPPYTQALVLAALGGPPLTKKRPKRTR